MNIQQLHTAEKSISTSTLLKGEEGVTKSMYLAKGGQLPKHQSKTPAVLICVIGEVIFEDEKGVKETLKQGDYVNIDPMVTHWANSFAESYLLLIK